MISVHLYDLSVPNIGRGRWTMPRYLLDNENFLLEIEKIASLPLHTCDDEPAPNPQRCLQGLILKIQTLAKQLEKTKAGKMNSMIKI